MHWHRRHRRPRRPPAALGAALLLAVAGCSPTAGADLPAPSPPAATVARQVLDVRVGAGPLGLALDDRGRLWTVNSGDGTVARLDAAARVVEQRVKVGPNPQRAAWWAGGLWVTLAGDGTVVRVDGETGEVTKSVYAGPHPDGIVAAFGSLYVVTRTDGQLVRIDPQTATVRDRVTVGVGSRRVTAGGDALWVSDFTSGTLSKVDPQKDEVVAVTDPLCVGPQGMLARDGQMWAACSGSEEVVSVDERTAEPHGQLPLPGVPDTLAPAANGDMWVSLQRGPRLALIDPRESRLLSSWPMGTTGTPREGSVDVTPLGERVWVSSYTSGRALGVDVTPSGR